jgi:exopolysaccharide biosynthesis polyprenyl glycosylphosphotransferase
MLGARLRFGESARAIWEEGLGLPPLFLLAAAFGALVVFGFWTAGVYRRDTHWSMSSELSDLARGWALVVVGTLSLLFLFKLEDVSRAALVIAFALLAIGSAGTRFVTRTIAQRSGGVTSPRRLLIVGASESAKRVVSSTHRHPNLGANVIGYLSHHDDRVEGTDRLGDIIDLPEALAIEVVDEVVICLEPSDWHKLDAIASACQEQGKTVRIPIDIAHHTVASGRVEDFDGIPMLSLLATDEHRLGHTIKRLIDIVGASFLLLIAAPILLIAIVMVWDEDGRPVLFAQDRGGLHGRKFLVWKLRTMVVEAENLRNDLRERNQRNGPFFKIHDDPRITRVGRWLRKTSIDELPQLFNVLRGDMSLVGPRPQPIEEVEAYDFWHRRRLSMKPGITGLWQITARNDAEFTRWMELDLEYIDRWSPWLDLSILARTPAALIRSPGS